MSRLFKTILFMCVFMLINISASAYQIGVWDSVENRSNPAFSIKSQNADISLVNKSNILTISQKNHPVIVFSKYNDVNDLVYNAVIKYLKNGGKIILVIPENPSEDKTFIKFAKLTGVNVEKITNMSHDTEINWVEKTVTNNTLKTNSRIANISLHNETTHLAVFGDIEKHESAITLNHNGVLFAWVWGKNANAMFNTKSMQYALEKLVPKSCVVQKNNQYTKVSSLDYDEDITSLNESRKYINNFRDNIINYSNDMSDTLQKSEISKTDELLAIYHAKNNNESEYKKYLQLSKDNLINSMASLNNLSPAETRGIWFDRGTIVSIKSKSEMGKYFDKLQKCGITTVYLETVNAGYAVYPSKFAPQNPLTRGKDMLSWAVDEAHARNMKIQAWIWVFAVGNDRHNKIIGKANDYPGPVLEKNMRWALIGENGNLRPKKQPEFWIDPSNKEGRQYIINITNEIVKNYNVDGIQLDYIRYPFQNSDNLMGFNHNSTEQFSAKTGEKLFNNNYQTNLLWNKWKENNINSFVRQVAFNTKRIKPSLKISAAIFSKPQDNRLNTIQQNYENWIKNSYVDFLTPMSYSISVEALNNNLSCLSSQNEACLIYPGIALTHVNQTGLLKQITNLREHGYNGVSFFAVAQLDDEKYKIMSNALYANSITDPTYNIPKSAVALLADYKSTLYTLKRTNYELSANQKNELDLMITNTEKAINQINSSQISTALATVKMIEIHNNNFFSKLYQYNVMKRKTPGSYLKRVINLLKIQIKKQS